VLKTSITYGSSDLVSEREKDLFWGVKVGRMPVQEKGILKGGALKRYLEDRLGFREGKKLLVAKVSSLP